MTKTEGEARLESNVGWVREGVPPAGLYALPRCLDSSGQCWRTLPSRTVHVFGSLQMDGQDVKCAPARAAVAMAHTTATGVDSTSAQGHAVTRICSARYTQCCTQDTPRHQP